MPYNINEATTGELLGMASESIGGDEYPISKPAFGGAGSATLVSRANPMPVEISPVTDNGLTPHHAKSAASTNDTLVKGSAAKLYSGHLFNGAATVKYFKLYNKASTPDVGGVDNPILVFPLPAGQMTRLDFGSIGQGFSLGLGYGITGGLANADTTAVAANDVIVNLSYK